MKKKDIIIFFSDQHSPLYTGVGGSNVVRTPNIDKLANDGTNFQAAYTSSPLCVPSRMSFLSGRLPSKTGVLNNYNALASDETTFLHQLANEEYETVLCGRMHFMGADQRHGFTKRIMDDFTTTTWGIWDKITGQLGFLKKSLGWRHCHEHVGAGVSPVLEYDKLVVKTALEYLEQDHEKPQCIVVGIYGPHSTYISPDELYDYYLEQDLSRETNSRDYDHPAIEHKRDFVDDDRIKRARAAHFGMIENMDKQIGEVRASWQDYLNRNNREGIFVYMSDHGDQMGERDLYGKQSFYEHSARIPLIFAGNGIKDNNEINHPVSIMDIGDTLCDIAGASKKSFSDGNSLINYLNGNGEMSRVIYSEFVETNEDGSFTPCRMVRKDKYKLISYYKHEEHDLLFDLEKDPLELKNIKNLKPNIYNELKTLLNTEWEPELVLKRHIQNVENQEVLGRFGTVTGSEDFERWQIPESVIKQPRY